MFLSPEMCSGGELTESLSQSQKKLHRKSGQVLLQELRWLPQVSHTWNTERREYIREQSVQDVIKIYNALVKEVSRKDILSPVDKDLLLSLEQEWTTLGGQHYPLIQEIIEKVQIIRTWWISIYNPNLWQVTDVAWYRKLAQWKL